MAIVSTASLVEGIRRNHLFNSKQLEKLARLQQRHPEPLVLARDLIRRGWLTAYQAKRLLQGRGHKLVVGPYVILDRLGEGGMGQVFKARHRYLRRIVALKLLRTNCLDQPHMLKRFEREARAAAALDHPHIVRAYDADTINGKPMLVMEYIPGAIDLSRLVHERGPLPAKLACGYVRQAALALQHAHERGLVHRDIKPHNLLVTADRKTIKLLDLGLARLDETSSGQPGTLLTQKGMALGSADYMAPEQAVHPHDVDIRADMYSLGCTLYFLLTAQTPFPDGSILEKLVKHQADEPEPVEHVRPDLSAEVAAVVGKMMAKKVQDRYQTPAEVAVALASVHRASHVALRRERECSLPTEQTVLTGTDPGGKTLPLDWADLVRETSAPLLWSPAAVNRRWLLYSFLAAGIALLGIVALLFALL